MTYRQEYIPGNTIVHADTGDSAHLGVCPQTGIIAQRTNPERPEEPRVGLEHFTEVRLAGGGNLQFGPSGQD